MTNIDAKFDGLKKLIEAAVHNFHQTRDTHRVAQFMETFVVPVVDELIHDIVGHRQCG